MNMAVRQTLVANRAQKSTNEMALVQKIASLMRRFMRNGMTASAIEIERPQPTSPRNTDSRRTKYLMQPSVKFNTIDGAQRQPHPFWQYSLAIKCGKQVEEPPASTCKKCISHRIHKGIAFGQTSHGKLLRKPLDLGRHWHLDLTTREGAFTLHWLATYRRGIELRPLAALLCKPRCKRADNFFSRCLSHAPIMMYFAETFNPTLNFSASNSQS